MALFDFANAGLGILLLGVVLWVLGILLPLVKVPAGELKELGKYVILIGLILFVVLLII